MINWTALDMRSLVVFGREIIHYTKTAWRKLWISNIFPKPLPKIIRNNFIIHYGHERTIYFFAKDEREGALDEIPEGYEVAESKNGLPVLKRAG